MTFGSQAWGWLQQGPPQLEARYSTWHLLSQVALVIPLGLFAGLMVWCFMQTHALGYILGLLIFAPLGILIGLSSLYLMVCKEPGLLLDSEGLRNPIQGSVRWKDVIGIDLRVMQKGNIFLELCLAPGAQMQGGVRWLRIPQRSTRVMIPLRGLDQNRNDIETAAHALRQQVQPPPLQNWVPGMDREMVDALWEAQDLIAQLQVVSPSNVSEMQRLNEALMANTERIRRCGERVQRSRRWQSVKALVFLAGVVGMMLLFRFVLFPRR